MQIPADSSNQLKQLRDWCRLPLGAELARIEQAALCEVLSDVFGYHLVVLDPPCQPDSLDASRILHRVVQSRSHEGLDEMPDLIASPEALPLQTDSIDALVLPHVLELAQEPHEVLREIDRCVVPEGHLVVLGFNPLGWWGLRKLIPIHRRQVPWSLRFISLPRLKDWLSLLGFDTVETRYLFPQVPWNIGANAGGLRLLDRIHRPGWPLLAASYLLVARKRVATLTPVKPRWRPRRAVLAGGMAETSQGKISSHG